MFPNIDKQGNSVARDLPRTGSETNTTIFVKYILDIEFFPLLNFQKCSWGYETHAQFFFSGGGGILGCLGRPTPPPGGRAGWENETLLPMAMTCDRF